jgi:hypothetical protein
VILSAILFRQSDPTAFIVWCILGISAGIYLFVQGFRLLQRRKLILNTPVSKVRSASMGVVELNGLAVGPYTVAAPITNRDCFYFRTIAWEWKQAGRSKRWVKIAAESMHVPFFLDDNTGKMMIDPRGADLDLHRDFQQEFCDGFFTLKEEAPPNVHSFLSRHGVVTRNKIKVEEFCIKPKNALFLLGTLDENPGLELTDQPIQDEEHNTLTLCQALGFNQAHDALGEIGFSLAMGGGIGRETPRDERSVSERLMGGGSNFHGSSDHSAFDYSSRSAAPQVVRLSPDPSPVNASDMTQQQKIAAALLKAGVLNPAAWASAAGPAAGVTPSTLAVSNGPNGSAYPGAPNSSTEAPQTTPLDGFDQRPPVVLMKGTKNPTFLISWRSQRDVARSLGWKCTLMIWGGPALTLLSLYALLALTHSL